MRRWKRVQRVRQKSTHAVRRHIFISFRLGLPSATPGVGRNVSAQEHCSTVITDVPRPVIDALRLVRPEMLVVIDT